MVPNSHTKRAAQLVFCVRKEPESMPTQTIQRLKCLIKKLRDISADDTQCFQAMGRLNIQFRENVTSEPSYYSVPT